MSSTDIKAQWLTCWLMQTNANLYLYIRRTFTHEYPKLSTEKGGLGK